MEKSRSQEWKRRRRGNELPQTDRKQVPPFTFGLRCRIGASNGRHGGPTELRTAATPEMLSRTLPHFLPSPCLLVTLPSAAQYRALILSPRSNVRPSCRLG